MQDVCLGRQRGRRNGRERRHVMVAPYWEWLVCEDDDEDALRLGKVGDGGSGGVEWRGNVGGVE